MSYYSQVQLYLFDLRPVVLADLAGGQVVALGLDQVLCELLASAAVYADVEVRLGPLGTSQE